MAHFEALKLWVVVFICAGSASLVFIFLLAPYAERLKLIDEPDYRKLHGARVPMVGGIAIYLAIFLALLFLPFREELNWLVISVGFLVCIGALDDAFGLGVKTRLISQVAASVFMIFVGGIWITSFGLGFWSFDSIPDWLGIILTIFAVVGLTNGFNMVDGMDGLASGHMLISLVTLGSALMLVHGVIHEIEWLTVIFAAVFAFWLVNLSLIPFKRVFLGDAGSLLLGFLMAWTLIYYAQKPVALLNPIMALWCVSIPVFDALAVIIRRLRKRRSPFAADRNHLHHLLIDTGMSPRAVLVAILTLSLATNAFGVFLTYLVGPMLSLIAYGIMLIVFSVIPPKNNRGFE